MSDPELIAAEYLRSGDLRLKKNALTLLRVAGGASGLGRLASEAVENDDADVRQWAGAQLAALDSDADRQAATEALRTIFASSGDRLFQLRAYSLLRELGVVTGTLFERLRLATKLRLAVYPTRGASFHARSLLPSLVGTAVALLLLLLYVSLFGLLRDDPAGTLGMTLVCALLASLLAPPLVTLRSVATGLYPDLRTSLLIECLTALGLTAVLALVGCIVAYIVTSPKPGLGGFAFTAGVPIAAVTAVRLGTVLAHRASRGPRTSLAAATAAGGSLGASVIIGSLLLNRGAGLADYWISLSSAMFGLAAAFAWIDLPGAGVKQRSRHPAKVAAFAAVTAFAALLALPYHELSRTRVDVGTTSTLAQISELPTTLRFALRDKTEVQFDLTSAGPQDPSDPTDPVVTLDTVNSKEVFTFDDPERFEKVLEPGSYTITVKAIDSQPAKGKGASSSVSEATIFAELFGTYHRVPSPLLNASLKGVPLTKETYRASAAVQGETSSIPVETAVTRVPFLRFVKRPRNSVGISVALLGQDKDRSRWRYEFALYNGTKELLKFAPEPGHHQFEANETSDYLIVVTKKDSPFVPTVKDGEAIVDTVPIAPGLTLYASTHAQPIPATYRPTGSSLTTLTGKSPDVSIPVTRLPFVQFLRVDTPRAVVIELPMGDVYQDLSLRLFDETGNVVGMGDNPETINTSLSRGLYWLVVHEGTSDMPEMKRGEVVLPVLPAPPGLLVKIR